MRPFLLSQLIDEARIDPDAVAVSDGARTLDYGQLVDRSGRLAAALVQAGVDRGDRVGIHLAKSVDSMVAVHGSLRAGAIHVPLDPMAPTAYTDEILRDCAIRVLITDAPTDRLRDLGGLTVVIGPDAAPHGTAVISWADVNAHDPIAPRRLLGADPAYIIYTSGSTGAPKGIVHSHRSGLRYAELAAATYGLHPGDRLANLAPLHFDQSTFELYAGPLAGATTFFVPDPVMRFPASLSELVERERITVWYSVPYLLVELLRRGVLDQRDLTSLRWVLYGGESFPPATLRALMEALPGARFSNVYGPAELNQCTYHHLDNPPTSADPVPIGRPWPDAEALVVDDEGRPVHPGDAGELWVRTATAMTGYWGRADLTAAAFRARPGAGGGPEEWYATGDIVVQRPDGALVFHGRADEQVKVRGHRVELDAVDSALRDCAGVDEATVVVDGDELVALVVVSCDIDHRNVLTQLRSQLPAYTVPARIVETDQLPRTATGKVDRPRAAAQLADLARSGGTA